MQSALPVEEAHLASPKITLPDLASTTSTPVDTGNDASSVGFQMSSWDDAMMWQLWQSQPSLDWFNSNLLDPASWDLSLPT